MEKTKLCLIVPEYQSLAATHFNYLYDLARVAIKDFDIFLIAEKGIGQPDFIDSSRFYCQRFHFVPLRIAENFLVLFGLRLRGYRNFYTHYSFVSALNTSLIVRLFGGRSFYWNCGLPWLYRRNFLRRWLERAVYKMITFLVTGTESLKKDYALHYRLPASRIKVMPNWINLAEFKPDSARVAELKKSLNLSEKNKVLLFVHRLSKRKGAHYLPEILNRLRNENIVMVVIGDGPEREAIELNVRSYMSNVRFLGWLPNRDLPNYYALADVFLLPSEEEGFPHVLLESMAAAVPFVASDVGGVREIIPEAMKSYLVKTGDAGQFADKIRELLYKKAEDLDFIKNSLVRWVERYNIRHSARAFINLIQNS